MHSRRTPRSCGTFGYGNREGFQELCIAASHCAIDNRLTINEVAARKLARLHCSKAWSIRREKTKMDGPMLQKERITDRLPICTWHPPAHLARPIFGTAENNQFMSLTRQNVTSKLDTNTLRLDCERHSETHRGAAVPEARRSTRLGSAHGSVHTTAKTPQSLVATDCVGMWQSL